jgi:DNA-binding transcriptional LysR family regulator
MREMNWAPIDLNLLIVFDAMLEDRSVTRAGRRVGLSQPAMSHALNRLRYMLKDELFVRTPEGMTPTPRAEELAEPLRHALNEMRQALEPALFDPATSDHRFTVAVDNCTAIVLVPSLVAAVSAAAPGVRLDILPRSVMDIVERLDHGELDLAVDTMDSPGARFVATQLFQDRLVLVMRRDHPVGRDALSARAIAALDFLDISSIQNDTAILDRWLASNGLDRRVALRAPYLSTVSILLQSDMVTILSRRIAEELARGHALRLCNLPFEAPAEQTMMLWPRRLDRQSAHRWLRGVIRSVSERL